MRIGGDWRGRRAERFILQWFAVPKLPNEREHRRLLVIFPGALGDMICALPAIRHIACSHPHADLEIMARLELARFAIGHFGAVRAHSLDRRETADLFEPSISLGAARSFFGNFDWIYSFFAADNQDFRKRLMAAAVGSVRFVPFRPPREGHIAVRYLDMAGDTAATEERAAGLGRIEILPEDLAAADERLAELGLQTASFWLIFPGSGSPRKNWPVEYFMELAGLLAPRMQPLAILGPAEAELARAFARDHVITLTDLDLGTVAGLARRASGFIGNDSGVSHLAASAGARGIVIFGPTDPAQWRPLGEIQVVRRDPLSALKPIEIARLAMELD